MVSLTWNADRYGALSGDSDIDGHPKVFLLVAHHSEIVHFYWSLLTAFASSLPSDVILKLVGLLNEVQVL